MRLDRRTFIKLASASLLSSSTFLTRISGLYSQTKEPMRDCIVLIPGIMGSVLTKNGKQIWSPSAAAPLNGLSSHFSDLRLSDDSLEDADVDGVVASGLVAWPHMLPDFWKIDAYTAISDMLYERFDVQQNHNYFNFPYDWRRDNRANAKKLLRLSREWLRDWRIHSGNPQARLILICHSMGGLIARYFLEVLQGWRDTDMLLTFGTPFRGSVNALTTLANGIESPVVPFRDELSDVMRSFPAVYQLLPYYKCCELQPEASRVGVADVIGATSLDQMKTKAAVKFHDEIRSAVEANQKNQEYASRAAHDPTRHAYKFAAVVGIEQSTAVFANIAAGKITPEVLNGYDGGDGTVPRGAAIPWEMEFNEGEFNVSGKHSALMTNSSALEHLGGVLSGLSFSSLRTGPQPALSLDLSDAYSKTKPVTLAVTPLESAQVTNLKVEVVSAFDSRSVKPIKLVKVQNSFHAEFQPLPPGAYRAKATAVLQVTGSSNQKPNLSVEDIFSVF